MNPTSSENTRCETLDAFVEPYDDNFRSLYVLDCVLNAVSAVPATVGNALIIAAVLRTRSLHTPQNTLLCCLASTDLLVGLIAQPGNIVFKLSEMQSDFSTYCTSGTVFYLFATCLAAVSFITITSVSIDRFLAIHLHLRYAALVTEKRVLLVIAVIWLVGLLLTGSWFWNINVCRQTEIVIILVCLILTSLCYVRIHHAIRRHACRIQEQFQATANAGEGQFFLARYRKSVQSMLCVYVALLLCFAPFLCLMVVIQVRGRSPALHVASNLSLTLLLMNSSLNPFLYCLKIREIRLAVMKIIRGKCAFPDDSAVQ